MKCYARSGVSGINVLCAEGMAVDGFLQAFARVEILRELVFVGVRFYGSKEKGDFA
jgi:hypothetical protein